MLSSRIFTLIGSLFLLVSLVSLVTGNPPPPYAARQEALPPPPPAQPTEPAAQGPPGRPLGGLIDVDVHDTGYGGKHVGVHVPVFYQMDLDKDPYGGRKGLGINVLEGLVKVRVKKDPYRIKDNVFVSVAGIPFWMQ